MQAAHKICVSGLKKAFKNKVILDGVYLDVAPGESLVIIGGSGTGKSVTLKCILGLETPDNGQILIDGKKTTGLSARERNKLTDKFGMLFQGGALFDSLTVWENIAFKLLNNYGATRKTAKDIAIEKLESVGLKSHVADQFPSELSGGMQKRVSLARAIATNPEIIFFDEPTTGLDPIMADVINDLIVKCTKQLGATAITITHDMASARKIADRIAMLYKGKIIWHGPAAAIDDSGNPFVHQFIHGQGHGPIEA